MKKLLSFLTAAVMATLTICCGIIPVCADSGVEQPTSIDMQLASAAADQLEASITEYILQLTELVKDAEERSLDEVHGDIRRLSATKIATDTFRLSGEWSGAAGTDGYIFKDNNDLEWCIVYHSGISSGLEQTYASYDIRCDEVQYYANVTFGTDQFMTSVSVDNHTKGYAIAFSDCKPAETESIGGTYVISHGQKTATPAEIAMIGLLEDYIWRISDNLAAKRLGPPIAIGDDCVELAENLGSYLDANIYHNAEIMDLAYNRLLDKGADYREMDIRNILSEAGMLGSNEISCIANEPIAVYRGAGNWRLEVEEQKFNDFGQLDHPTMTLYYGDYVVKMFVTDDGYDITISSDFRVAHAIAKPEHYTPTYFITKGVTPNGMCDTQTTALIYTLINFCVETGA